MGYILENLLVTPCLCADYTRAMLKDLLTCTPFMGLLATVMVSLASSTTAASGSRSTPCPFEVIPGVALGVVRLGSSLEELKKSAAVTKETTYDKNAYLEAGLLRVWLRDGRVREVWLEDIRKASSCVTMAGAKIDPNVDIEALPKLFGPCHREDRKGGSFFHCKDATLHFGFGDGHYLQLRVSDKSWWLEKDR